MKNASPPRLISWSGRRPLVVLLSFAFAGILACGGGGGSDPVALAPPPAPDPVPDPDPPPTGGIDRSGVSIGVIDGFGSIFVNGVRFDTTGAAITVDGVSGDESALAVGQVATVSGTLNDDGVSGVANTVDVDGGVLGPIESVDSDAGSLRVLGQQIAVTPETVFGSGITPADLTGLDLGDRVRVRGLDAASGGFVATLIAPGASGGGVEVEGAVADLDTAALTFRIGDLVVDYSAAMLIGFDTIPLADGVTVEVKGDITNLGIVSVTTVERETDADPDDGDVGELEGLITRFVAAADFDVAGIPVAADSQTAYEGGTEADLAVGARIEVEGAFIAGVLQAEEIDFQQTSDSELSGPVEAIDTAAGTLTVLGVTITTDASTQFEDREGDDDTAGQPFSLADIATGDYVEVRGVEAGTGDSIAATRIERDDADDEFELDGVVDEVLADALVVFGITVGTDLDTEYRDDNDAPLSAAEFFARASAGQRVEIDARDVGGSLVATEMQLDDE